MGLAWLQLVTWMVAGPTELSSVEPQDAPPDAVMGDGLAVTGPESPPPAPPAVCAAGPELPGIDVSKWNGDIDWPQVAASGIEYAFIRVSDGTTHFDPMFDQNWAEARAAGVHAGVYQFFRPNRDVQAQAQLLLDHMGALGPDDLPPVIDVEAHGDLSPSAVAAAVGEWIDIVESATGVQPIIYTGRYFWQDYVASSAWSDYPLWIAHYTTGCPNLPAQWSDWVFHQYTESGTVPGIAGDVDRNDFNGDLAALQSYMASPGVCGDGTCSGGEDSDSCPNDCEACGTIDAFEDTIIDDDDACMEMYGDDQYWRSIGGFGGQAFWTTTTNTQTYNYALWQLNFASAGDYVVEVHIPGGTATITAATYQVQTATGTVEASLDQSSADGWVELGTFAFGAGAAGQHIRLGDRQEASGLQLVFDAVRLYPSGGGQPTMPPDANDDPDADSGPTDPGGGDDGEDEPGSDGDDDGDDTDGGAAALPGGSRRGGPQGCAITGRTHPTWWMLSLLLVARRRRLRSPATGETRSSARGPIRPKR